ncbi:MAG: PspA/IM30 family protein [Chitinophagales bacterium]|nr:PspA/IM30 family protein [Bacteroidota bacterium]
MNIFRRILNIFKAETNAAIDKLENPIKVTEQGIRDLKNDLNKSVEALANVKALAIRSKKEADDLRNKSADYQGKAVALLKKAETGEVDATQAERLAREALTQKQQADTNLHRVEGEQARLEKSVVDMQAKITQLRNNINSWENELRTLKSRVQVSDATQKLNKQLSQIDPDSTLAMLEKMKEKVNEQEALAESYESLANEARSLDQEISDVLKTDVLSTSVEDELAALKASLKSDKA